MSHSSILNSRKIFKSVFVLITFLTLLCANFISCDNFLNGGDIKKEIEDVIAFNNAKVVNVSLACDEAVGTLFPNQTYQAHVGYAFEVQFIPDTSEYKIKDASKIFKAESLRDNSDRSDNVKIEALEQSFEDKKSGVYRANITIIKYADDIRIRPDCVAVPKINKITPENKKNGEDQDTPIIITFNKPMDAASFGDYSCISISSSEGNVWDYYDAPEFSDDKTQLTIQPKAGVLLLPPDEPKTSDEITLSIDCTDIKDTDGLSLTQSSLYSFRINQSYGNRKVVELTVKVDDSSIGTITPEGKVSCNVGYTTTLQFELNKKEYILSDSETALKAVSANGGSVSFTTLSTTQTENTVIYTIKARVLKEANDIVITPNCIKIPKLVSITPQQISTGCDQDTPIKIKFNKAVDPESFGDFSCISISNENQDLKQYFGNPYFSENNTTLTIPTAQNTLILPPDGSKLQMDITVTIDSTNLKDEDNIALPQIEKYKYTINKNFGNQKKITVLIRTVEGTGTFLVDGERECVVGYSLGELQFTPNTKSVVFLGLEAVSKDDTSVSRNDSVEFTQINNTNGVYIIRVRVKEEINDILIRPKYILRPAIVSYTPWNTEQSSEPIVFTFNRAVQDPSLDTCIFNFTNVSIKCYNDYIEDCFNPPVLNADKTVMTIFPKSDKFNALLQSYKNNNAPSIDITVSFDSRLFFNIDNYSVQFAEDKGLSFTSSYATTVESVIPVKQEFCIYRSWNSETNTPSDDFYQSTGYFIYDYTSNNMNQRDSLEYYNNYTDEQILQNRTKGTVYIWGQFIDEDSGVTTIKVNEQFMPTDLYDPPENDEWNITVNYNKNSEEAIYWDEDDGITTFCIEHEIMHHDCTLQIETTIIDACGNSAATEYVTINKISQLSITGQLQNRYFDYDTYWVDDDDVVVNYSDFDTESFSQSLKNIKFVYDNEYGNDELLYTDCEFVACIGGQNIDPEKVYTKIECHYIDDDGTPQKLKMNKHLYDQDEYPYAKNWNCDLVNIQNVNGLTVTIYVEDDLGNSGTCDFTFPSPQIVEAVETSGTSKTIHLAKTTEYTSYEGIIIYKAKNSNSGWKVRGYDDCFTMETGYEYYYISTGAWYLTSELSSLISVDTNFEISGVSDDFEFKFSGEPVLESCDSDETTIVTVSISEESWNYFDNVYVKDNRGLRYYFEQSNTQLQFRIGTTKLFTSGATITLFGQTGIVCKQGEEKTISLSDIAYDNVAPKYYRQLSNRKENNIDKYLIGIQEYESSLESITFNGKPYSFISYDSLFPSEYSHPELYVVQLDLYDCIDYTAEIPTFRIKIGATDSAGNYNEIIQNEHIKFSNTPYLSSINNETPTKWVLTNDGDSGAYYISKFNTTTNKWVLSYFNRYGYSFITFDLATYYCTNSFIKMFADYSVPRYYYTGLDSNRNFKNSGKYDYILPNGSSKTSVVISSDAPVLVHTKVTAEVYDVCKNWDVDDWEFYKKEIGNKQFNFTTRDQEKYTIPTDEIKKNECYVVIAHFADGTSAMSDVMVKY